MRKVLIFFLTYFLIFSIRAQDLDSLKIALKQQNRARRSYTLLRLAKNYYKLKQNDSAIYYLSLAEKIATHKQKPNLLAQILTLKAKIAYDSTNYSKTIALCDSAMKLATDSTVVNDAKLTLANTYTQIGLYKEAYQIYRDLLKFYHQKKDTLILSKLYSNIGTVFYNLDMLDSSFYYSRLVVKLDSIRHDTEYLVIDYINMAAIIEDTVFPDSVDFYLKKALSYAKKINDPYLLGAIYINLGASKTNLKQYQQAIRYLKQAIKYFKQARINEQTAYAYLNITDIYLKLKQLQYARIYFDSAQRSIALINQLPNNLKEYYYQTAMDFYSSQNDYKQAFYFLQKYTHLKDSLQLGQQKEQLMLYNLKEKILANKLKLELEKQNTKKLISKKKFFQNLAIITSISLTIVIFLIIILIRAYRKLKISTQRDAILATLYEIRQLVAKSAIEKTSLNTLLQEILDKILSNKHLQTLPKGMIFLVNKDGNLELVAYKNIGELGDKCRTIQPGECVCGRTLELQQTIITEEKIHNHKIDEGHGHYVAPLISNDKVLGVLNLYFKPSTRFKDYTRKLLESLAYEIASIIERYSQQLKIIETARDQNELSQKLFAQTLKLEIKNRQLDEAYKKLDEAYKKLDDQSKLLQQTLQSLQDSITFASYLVQSYLPSEEYLEQILEHNYFIFFKPKDVIGGDFYFIEKTQNKLVILVGDATGHGVPGALLATQTVTFIRHIIFEDQNLSPVSILTELRTSFKRLFKHTDILSIKNISVDLAICVVDLTTNIMTYAGAFLPALIIRNNKIIKLRPTRNPIGNYIREREYTEQTIQLYPGDMVYLQSDGFQDQMNEALHKFLRKNYEQLLLEIHPLEPAIQRDILESVLKQWQGKQPQTDDITVVGIRWQSQTDFLTRL